MTLPTHSPPFRWCCPYLTCQETFMCAWQRREHLKSVHWINKAGSSIKTEKGSVSDLETHVQETPITEVEDKVSVSCKTPEERCASFVSTEPRCPPQKYNLINGGDFIAVLGSEEEGEAEILVSSNSLSVSCSTWNRLCSGGFRESVEKRAKFPEDDPDAMLLLFHIAHLKFSKVPAEISLGDLYHLAVICDKYDTGMLLQPWLRRWFDKYKLDEKPYLLKSNLFISWVFGDAVGFEELSRSMVMSSIERIPGILSINGVISSKNTLEVPQIIDQVLKVRKDMIETLFQMCDSYISELTRAPKCKLCGGLLCNALDLGSLLQGLYQIGVWPDKRLEDHQNSKTILELRQSLLAIKFHEKSYPRKTCTGMLKRDFATEVNRICNSISPVLPFHREKLAERNRILGLFPDDTASP